MSEKEKKEKTPKYTVVAATFADEASAEAALEALKAVEKVYAADLVVMGEDGKFKKHREGKRQPGRGLGWGIVLGLVVALLPGIGLAAVASMGGLGLIIGAFSKRGESKEYVAKVVGSMKPGQAAIIASVPYGSDDAFKTAVQASSPLAVMTHDLSEQEAAVADKTAEAAEVAEPEAAEAPAAEAPAAEAPAAEAPAAEAPAAEAPAAEAKPAE
ncbi:MAG: DUF1269 domain-containing protein [Anaerolineae bacterium]